MKKNDGREGATEMGQRLKDSKDSIKYRKKGERKDIQREKQSKKQASDTVTKRQTDINNDLLSPSCYLMDYSLLFSAKFGFEPQSHVSVNLSVITSHAV
jgi:hypothetical protein